VKKGNAIRCAFQTGCFPEKKENHKSAMNNGCPARISLPGSWQSGSKTDEKALFFLTGYRAFLFR